MSNNEPVSIICPLCRNIAENVRFKSNDATIYPKKIRLKGKKQGSKREYMDMEKATIKLISPSHVSFTCEKCNADISITSRDTLTIKVYDAKGEFEVRT